MADTTAISEEEFIETYLGLTPRDILRSSDLLNDNDWDSFWSGVKAHIATSVLLNPQDGDTEEEKKEKALLKKRAQDFLYSWQSIAGDRRNRKKEDSEFIRQAKGFVAAFEQMEETIVESEVVRIGQTLFGPENLDPTDIRVSEVHSVQRLGTLRSDTDAAVKLPRSMTQVTVDLVFTGANQINQRFRPMLGELLASPVTTMESAFLTAALVNHYSMPEIEAELKRRVYAGVGKNTLDGFDALLDKANSSFETLREIFRNDDLLLEYFRQREMDRSRQTGPIGAAVAVEEQQNVPPIGVSVPVCFQDIVVTTDPISPDTLHVRLAFNLFNSRAFGAFGIEYRDNAGNRTTDIMRCGVLRKYIEMAFLKPRQDGGPPFLGEYNAHLLGDTPDFQCRWRDLIDPGLVRNFPEGVLRFVVNSVQASLGIKAVPLPIIGSKFPAIQILGRANVQARVVLQTTSTEVVRKFALMKDHVDAISRNVGGQYRDEFVDIQNSVLNLLGARRFVISSVEMIPMEETSNGYEISVTLLQAEYSYREQQALVFQDETVPKDLLADFWRYLYKKAAGAITKSPLPDGALPVATAEETMAFQFLFGTADSNAEAGIINADVLAAGVLRVYAKQYGLNPSDQELIFKIYEENFTKGDPGSATMDQAVGMQFLEVKGSTAELDALGQFIGPTAGRRGIDPYDSFGKFVRGMISGDEVLGSGGYDAFRAVQLGFRFSPVIRGATGQILASIYPKDVLWEGILEAMVDIRDSAFEVENVSRRETNSNPVYSTEQIAFALARMTSIFTDGRIGKFGFDVSPYREKLEAGNMTVMDLNVPDAAKRRVVSNYPDVPLPTYDELFRGELDLTVNGGDGASAELWTRFCPTYFDLGMIPPDGIDVEHSFRIARKKTDIMEPGFWFFHQRSREEQLRRAKHAISQIDGQRIGDIDKYRVSLDEGIEDLRDLPEGKRGETFQELFWAKYQQDKNVKRKVDSARRLNQYIEVVDKNGHLIGIYEPKGPAAANGEFRITFITGRKSTIAAVDGKGVYDRSSVEHNKALTARILQTAPDNTLSMTRIFPAIRVWFVEWDNNLGRAQGEKLRGRNVRMIDDLYTSNAIISVHITDSKDEGSVAEVMVLNTVGTFDTDSFLLPNEAKEISLQQGTTEIGPDDEGEGFLRRMKLQTGTGIVIDMGYSSDFRSLKTVFTGSITEIEPGKVIKFIAQGYKAELDQDVDILVQRDNAAEAIRELIQMGQPAKKNPTPHLGRIFDARDLDEQEKIRVFGPNAIQSTGFLGLEGPGGSWASWFGRWANTSLRNVYVETNSGPATWLGQQWQNIREWEIFRWVGIGTRDAEWHFYSMTAWQGLQEMTRHLPGSICTVRPYGNEGTIFFGYPDQPYEYRPARALETQEWYSKVSGARSIAIVGTLLELVQKFWGSPYGTTNQLLLNQHIEQAKRVGRIGDTMNRINNGGFLWSMNYYGGTYVIDQRKKNDDRPTLVDDVSPSFLGYLRWADVLGSFGRLSDIGGFPDAVAGLDTSESGATGWRNLAIYETLGLDFFQDWQAVQAFHPELGRFLFYYFFRLPYYSGSQIGGGFEPLWHRLVDIGMQPLIDRNNSPNNAFNEWVRFLQGMEADGDFEESQTFGTPYERDSSWDNLAALIRSELERVDQDLRAGLIDAAEAQRRREVYNQLLSQVSSFQSPDVTFDLGVAPGQGQPLRPYYLKGKTLGNVLFDYFPRFRLFIHYFAEWMRKTQSQPDAPESFRQTDVKQGLDNLQVTTLPPWMKQFRDYHMIFSNHDIIDNSIVASMGEMFNTFVIRHPGEALPERSEIESPTGPTSFISAKEWKSYPDADGFPFHGDLKQSQRRLAVCVEPNANEKCRIANTLLSNVCEGIRPMYRGEIKFLGRVVFPWDVILISDEVNGMMGVIEVDRVTHEFTTETGWVTTVVPHAYCHPLNPYGIWQLTTTVDWMATLDTVLNIVTVLSSVLFIFRGLAALGAVARSKLVEDFVAKRVLVTASGSTVTAEGAEAANLLAQGMRRPIEAEIAAIAKDMASRGLIPTTLRNAETGALSRAAIGRFMAQNWMPILSRVGRHIGFWSIANEAIPPAASLLFGLSTKSRVHDLAMPVDLRVVSLKGAPLTAGLDLGDSHFDTFDTRFKNFYSEFMRTMNRWLFDVSPPTVTSAPSNTTPDGG
jgi:hypothetical protein